LSIEGSELNSYFLFWICKIFCVTSRKDNNITHLTLNSIFLTNSKSSNLFFSSLLAKENNSSNSGSFCLLRSISSSISFFCGMLKVQFLRNDVIHLSYFLAVYFLGDLLPILPLVYSFFQSKNHCCMISTLLEPAFLEMLG